MGLNRSPFLLRLATFATTRRHSSGGEYWLYWFWGCPDTLWAPPSPHSLSAVLIEPSPPTFVGLPPPHWLAAACLSVGGCSGRIILFLGRRRCCGFLSAVGKTGQHQLTSFRADLEGAKDCFRKKLAPSLPLSPSLPSLSLFLFPLSPPPPPNLSVCLSKVPR